MTEKTHQTRLALSVIVLRQICGCLSCHCCSPLSRTLNKESHSNSESVACSYHYKRLAIRIRTASNISSLSVHGLNISCYGAYWQERGVNLTSCVFHAGCVSRNRKLTGKLHCDGFLGFPSLWSQFWGGSQVTLSIQILKMKPIYLQVTKLFLKFTCNSLSIEKVWFKRQYKTMVSCHSDVFTYTLLSPDGLRERSIRTI